ncbi:MAG: aspartate-semialdehyde dehydrogenase, partial [Acidobacteriota bacterium]
MSYRVAILGATGLVGQTLLRLLEERAFPVRELVPLASQRSVGKPVRFAGDEIPVRLAEPEAFEGVDLVLSSAGASVSRELLPAAVERGAVAIDNTSAYRMDPEVPLVVPEVNPHRIADYGQRGIIANPNCSTIQLVVALKPLHDAFGVRRVIVSTYQSVSGAGQRAVDELVTDLGELDGTGAPPADRREALAFNALPKIDVFVDDGETREEWKMRVETSKIMEASIPLHATCVRVPIVLSHSEAVWIETEKAASPEEVRDVLRGAEGLVLV